MRQLSCFPQFSEFGPHRESGPDVDIPAAADLVACHDRLVRADHQRVLFLAAGEAEGVECELELRRRACASETAVKGGERR